MSPICRRVTLSVPDYFGSSVFVCRLIKKGVVLKGPRNKARTAEIVQAGLLKEREQFELFSSVECPILCVNIVFRELKTLQIINIASYKR
mgnify:CR=1 FL=1